MPNLAGKMAVIFLLLSLLSGCGGFAGMFYKLFLKPMPKEEEEQKPVSEEEKALMKEVERWYFGDEPGGVIVKGKGKDMVAYLHLYSITYSTAFGRKEDIKREQMGLVFLAEYMSSRTTIKARVCGNLFLSDKGILKCPIVYIAGTNPLKLTEGERQNIREYIEAGGFLIIDNLTQNDILPFARSVEYELREALGGNYNPFKIPLGHEIYHSYYSFPDGPPAVPGEGTNPQGNAGVRNYWIGIEIGDRIAVLITNKGEGLGWRNNIVSVLKAGVNMMAYGLSKSPMVRRIHE